MQLDATPELLTCCFMSEVVIIVINSPLSQLLFSVMATKDISVNGTSFPCPVGWTVDQAVGQIRSEFGLQFGGLRSDGIPQLGCELISNISGSLALVGGQPVQVPSKFPSIISIQFLILCLLSLFN